MDYKQLCRTEFDTVKKKMSDYSEADNVYSAFEEVAKICDCTAQQAILTQCGVKVARLKNLVGKNQPIYFEAIEDTISDLRNYLMFATHYDGAMPPSAYLQLYERTVQVESRFFVSPSVERYSLSEEMLNEFKGLYLTRIETEINRKEYSKARISAAVLMSLIRGY